MHGTDTLAYTASALSFMLENLGKPVIVTGTNNDSHTFVTQIFYSLLTYAILNCLEYLGTLRL